jgi:uncharacterized protein YkwD
MRRFVLTGFICLALAACGASVGGGAATAPAQVVQVAGGTAQAQLNAVRAAAGQRGVTRSGTLDAVAHAHGSDMVQRNFFSRTGSNGSSVGQRVRAAGYGWCMVAEEHRQGPHEPDNGD